MLSSRLFHHLLRKNARGSLFEGQGAFAANVVFMTRCGGSIPVNYWGAYLVCTAYHARTDPKLIAPTTAIGQHTSVLSRQCS